VSATTPDPHRPHPPQSTDAPPAEGTAPGSTTADDTAPGSTTGAEAPSAHPALDRLVREVEQHVAADGWDRPPRLFALVRTVDAIARDPRLVDLLPPELTEVARTDPGHLTAVEQEDLPEADRLEDLLAQVFWPPTVDGVALSVERTVLPPRAEAEVLARSGSGAADEAELARALRDHPERQDLRMVAAVLRGGGHSCAVRSRAYDGDALVAVGAELVPGLVAALSATLEG